MLGLVLIIINAYFGGQFATFWSAITRSSATQTGGSGPGGSKKIPGSAAVIPKVAGQCPKGYLWDSRTKTCLQELI